MKGFYCLLMLLASLAIFVGSGIANASQHDALKPLLVDLKGWKGQEAEGMSMDMAGMKMINVTRNYTRDSKELDAVLMVGTNALAQQDDIGEMTTETDDGVIRIKKIDGFVVQSVHEKKDKSGSVIVFLGRSQVSGAVFTLTYNGLQEEDAMGLAKSFDWQKMKTASAGML